MQGRKIMKRKEIQCVHNLRGCLCCREDCRALWVMPFDTEAVSVEGGLALERRLIKGREKEKLRGV